MSSIEVSRFIEFIDCKFEFDGYLFLIPKIFKSFHHNSDGEGL